MRQLRLAADEDKDTNWIGVVRGRKGSLETTVRLDRAGAGGSAATASALRTYAAERIAAVTSHLKVPKAATRPWPFVTGRQVRLHCIHTPPPRVVWRHGAPNCRPPEVRRKIGRQRIAVLRQRRRGLHATSALVIAQVRNTACIFR